MCSTTAPFVSDPWQAVGCPSAKPQAAVWPKRYLSIYPTSVTALDGDLGFAPFPHPCPNGCSLDASLKCRSKRRQMALQGREASAGSMHFSAQTVQSKNQNVHKNIH